MINGFLFWTGETEYESWKYYGIEEVWNFRSTSCMALYSFLARIFLQWIGLEKEYRKQNQRMNIVKIVDKVDKEDKLVEN